MDAFEQQLQKAGFILEDMTPAETKCGKCRAAKGDKIVLYYQTDSDDLEWKKQHPLSKDYEWWKVVSCEKCFTGHLETLDCGGHYQNMRIFRHNDGADVTEAKGCKFHALEPNKIVYEDEEEIIDDCYVDDGSHDGSRADGR
jgi:hypothetical protein